MLWHTRNERKAIRERGGKPIRKYGYDGVSRTGKPIEVREARKDNRFRIQKNTHRTLVRGGGWLCLKSPSCPKSNHKSRLFRQSRGGSYIFKSGSKTKRVSARRVSKLVGRGKWYKDRSYPHKFVRKRQIF